jgi:hypothetical protein
MYIREGHERRGTNSPKSKHADFADEENPDMKAGQGICRALVAGKSYKDIHELLQASHPSGKAALSLKSCQETRHTFDRFNFFDSPFPQMAPGQDHVGLGAQAAQLGKRWKNGFEQLPR